MSQIKFMTFDEVNQHVDHYNVYRSLPHEVMEYLFGCAIAMTALKVEKDTGKNAVEVVTENFPQADEAPKPSRKRPNPGDAAPKPPGHNPVA